MAQPRKLHDRFFKLAKEEGYAARSAYKLKQVQEKRRIIRRGDRVLDLGCAPGSWLQVACELVGPNGHVGGIDLKPVEIKLPSSARTMVGDIFKTDSATLLSLAGTVGEASAQPGLAPGPPLAHGPLYDVLLSDMAPNTEGGAGGSGDHFRSVDLCRRVLELAPSVLRASGNLVMKVFEGEAYPELLRDVTRTFEETKGFKPEASREVSREMYIVAKGFRSPRGGEPSASAQAKHALAPAPPKLAPGWSR